jgi:hypothetical protein
MGLWIIMGITLGFSLILVAISRLQVWLHKRRRSISPIKQPNAADDGHDELAVPSVDLPATLKAKLAGSAEPAAGGIGAYRTDAVAEISLAGAGKRVSFGGGGGYMQQPQQQQVPRLAAQLFSPTGQGPAGNADAAGARAQGFTPRTADEAAVVTAKQVSLEHAVPSDALAQPHSMQQHALDESDAADSVLML